MMASELGVDYVQLTPIIKPKQLTEHPNDADSLSISHPSSSNLSLFPLFDIFIKLLPSYHANKRSNCSKTLIICPSIIAILSLPVFQIYAAFRSKIKFEAASVKFQLLICAMYSFSIVGSFARIHFFSKLFDFAIWHHRNNENVSHLLRLSPKKKSKVRKNVCIGMTFIILLNLLFAASLTCIGSLFYFDLMQMNYKQIAFGLLLFVLLFAPNALVIGVCRIYLTESCVHILHFTDSIKVITSFSAKSLLFMDDAISFDAHSKYLAMFDAISLRTKQTNCFLLIWTSTLSFAYWQLIALFLFTDWEREHVAISQKFDCLLYAQLFFFAFQSLVALIFALLPAVKMSELFQELENKISDQIIIILNDRKYFHDERLLSQMTQNEQSEDLNADELKKKIKIYSKQRACLEVLNRLKLTMKEKPCNYNLFGCVLNRWSIRDLFVSLLVAKIFIFLWNGIV